ncbi:hypothetical protein, partial [Streptomyces sp. NPDC002156]
AGLVRRLGSLVERMPSAVSLEARLLVVAHSLVGRMPVAVSPGCPPGSRAVVPPSTRCGATSPP